MRPPVVATAATRSVAPLIDVYDAWWMRWSGGRRWRERARPARSPRGDRASCARQIDALSRENARLSATGSTCSPPRLRPAQREGPRSIPSRACCPSSRGGGSGDRGRLGRGGAAAREAPVRTAALRHRGRRPLERSCRARSIELLPTEAEQRCRRLREREGAHRRRSSPRSSTTSPPPSSSREYVRPKYACPRCQRRRDASRAAGRGRSRRAGRGRGCWRTW